MDSLLDVLKKYTLLDLRPGYIREYHDAVKAAIADGKLTEQEISTLEIMKEEYGISEDALSAIKLELYTHAFAHLKEQPDITEDEWDEMEQIQDYLNITDAEAVQTKKELYRMHILSEIKKGNLPIFTDEGVTLDTEELLHWKERIDFMKEARMEEGRSLLRFSNDAKEDSGMLYITSKRIVCRGAKETFSVRLMLCAGAEYCTNGFILHREGGKPLIFRYKERGNHNVVGSVLASVLALSRS